MSTNTIVGLVGKVATLGEIHAAAKVLGYEVVVGGLSGFDGLRSLAMCGDWRYKRPDGTALLVEVQGMCAECALPLDRWINWYHSKEEGTPLEAQCAGGHVTHYEEDEEKVKMKVLGIKTL